MTMKLIAGTSARAQIINALFACIYEKGLSGVSMRQIAAKAGINLGSLHYYFKSKENLLIEFNQALFDRFIEDVRTRFRPSDKPRKKLDSFLSGGKDFVLGHKETFVVLIELWSAAIRIPSMQVQFNLFHERLAALMDDILEEGRKQGDFNAIKKQTLSRVYVSCAEGIGLNWYIHEGTLNAEEQFRLLITQLKKSIIKAK